MSTKTEARAWDAFNKAIIRVRKALNGRGYSFEVNFEIQELRRKQKRKRTANDATVEV